MTVLQMGPYPPPHGGVQTNLVALRKYLLKQGIGCPVINLTRFRREERDSIYYPKTVLDVIKLLVTLRYDVIHLHAGGDFSPRHVGVLLLCSLLPGKKTVFTFHSGGYPTSEAGQRAKPRSPRGFVLRRLDGIVAINQELFDLFLQFGVAPQRIRLIAPHAVEKPSADTPLPQAMEQFYAAHDPLLVTVSGLEPEYDVPLQIEAIGRLRASTFLFAAISPTKPHCAPSSAAIFSCALPGTTAIRFLCGKRCTWAFRSSPRIMACAPWGFILFPSRMPARSVVPWRRA
jgi:glycosyltransferase involved in cell wall biosynthesis